MDHTWKQQNWGFRLAGLLAIALISQPALAENPAPDADPYSRIERIVEPNGLEVFVSPQDAAKNVEIRIWVKAGGASEEKKNAGVSHMVEHYLFTDAKLTPDMTYLEAIRERHGSGNAHTTKMG